MRLVASAIVCGVITIAQANAADLGNFTSKEGRVVVTLTGDIVPGDADRLVAAIRGANDAGREVSGVRLNSLGGDLSEGVKLASAIRFAKIATVVMNGTTCASACFIAFAAGVAKFASYGGRIGVHGASQSNGSGTADAPAGTVAMAKIVRDLGVPPGIIGQMVVTPPDEIVWLSSADLQSMGVKMTGKPTQTAAAAQLPQQTLAGSNAYAPSAPVLNAALPASKDEQWTQILNSSVEQSMAQNHGTANMLRNCQPELKLCNTAILFKGKDGKDMMVRVTKDPDDRMISRDLCSFNDFGDVRECLDWDKGTTSKEMKNTAGEWIGIN